MADIKSILDAFNSAAGVIKMVAEAPGINMIPYANTISGAISAIQFAYKAGTNISEYVSALKNTFSNGIPSQDQLTALDNKIAALRAELHAPLPPLEEGEPD